MDNIKTSIDKELSAVAADAGILQTVLDSKRRVRVRAPFVIAALVAVFALLGMGFSDYIGGWLNEHVRWWTEPREGTEGAAVYDLYTEQTIDGVTVKAHVNNETKELVLEFTGASAAVWTDGQDEDVDVVFVYAQKAEGSEFTLTIAAEVMFGEDLRGYPSDNGDGQYVYRSKGWRLFVVDDLADVIK